MKVRNTLLKITKNRQRLPKWSILLGLSIFTIIAIVLTKDFHLLESLEAQIAQAENQYQKWGNSQPLNNH